MLPRYTLHAIRYPLPLPTSFSMPHSPHYFAEHVLHLTLWPKINDIIDAVHSGKRKILVRSANGVGKTTTIAALCNWKLSTMPESIVLTTASSWVQVRRTLWGEIRKQAKLASLYEGVTITSAGIHISDKHYALGIAPNIPENAQGFHAPSMLIAVDEATGVHRDIINALWGNATGEDAQMILIYNPIDTSSFPFEAEARNDWHLITISAFDHPNVRTGTLLIPGAVTRTWIEDRMHNWSYEVDPPEGLHPTDYEDPDELHRRFPRHVYLWWLNKWYAKTAIVANRICGEWPEDSSSGFITQEVINASLNVNEERGTKMIGVDVARSGEDQTVIAFFDGNTQLPFECTRGRDLMRTANRIKALFDEGWTLIGIDDTGLGGGVVDRLRELNVPVHAISFGAKPAKLIDKELLNVRAELHFVLEDELRRGKIRLLNDVALHQELIAARLSRPQSLYKIQPKDEIQRELGRSPDKADATMIARYAHRLVTHRAYVGVDY